jgi:hypothetical protein
MVRQHRAKGLVGKNTGEVIYPAIAFGFADDGNDLVGGNLSGLDPFVEAGCIGHALDFDLSDFNGHDVFP